MAIIQRTMSEAIRWYDQNVFDVSRRYESVAAETVHGWLVDLLSKAPALALDVGAGTGRDVVGSLHVAWQWPPSSRPAPCAPKRAAASFAVDPMGAGFFAWPRPGVAWVYPLI
jgi:hypothetical protein